MTGNHQSRINVRIVRQTVRKLCTLPSAPAPSAVSGESSQQIKLRLRTKYASWSMVLCNLLIPNTCWKCAFKTSRSCEQVRKNGGKQSQQNPSTHAVRESPYMKHAQPAEMIKKEKGSEPMLTRKEQCRDKRKGKKPTRERKFASWTTTPPRDKRLLPKILTVRGVGPTESTHLSFHRRWLLESDTP